MASKTSARVFVMLALALMLVVFAARIGVAQEGEGDAAVDPASVPGLVPFQSVQSLSAGEEGNCVVSPANALFCWGNGVNGQNGNDTSGLESTPAAITTLSNVTQVNRGGDHACAVVQAGDLSCWGVNSSGELGTGVTSTTPSLLPVKANIAGARSVAAGGAFTCALRTDGQPWCWGDNTYGQLGTGTLGGSSPVPAQVTGIANVTAIDAGMFHVCALTATGEVFCWGSNSDGQIGYDGAPFDHTPTPAKALLPEPVVQITAGGTTSCARTAGGKVYCWGSNVSGQVGTFGSSTQHNTPVAPQSLEVAIAGVDTNGSSTCAWTTIGQAYCWGANGGGQLGGGVGPGGPQKISVMGLPAPVRSLSVGAFHVCAILIDGRVVCWGSNQGNALGDGTNLESVIPNYVRRPGTCFQLILARGGSGALPVATPAHSNGCPIQHYVAGTLISIAAIPNAQNRVNSWTTPVSFQAGNTLALISMPNADTTATVTYATCRVLTRTHTGNGGNPTPSFNNSSGCAPGRYAQGEVIMLAATPSSNQRVQAWTGTSIAPGLGLGVNSVTMPDADLTVTVAYQTCNVLTISATGAGDPPGVFPASSEGCAAGTFVEGQTIQFTAVPAAGFRVSGWSGTANDASTALTNSLTMPASDRAVGVTYVIEEIRTLLPLVGR